MVDQKIAFRRIAAGLLAVLLAFCHGALTPGQEIPVPPMLELGTSIERRLSGGEVHVYALRLAAGQFFEACVERLGMALDVTVFSPTGRSVAQGDGAWTNTECDMVSHIAEEPGTYRLEVRPLFPTGAARSYRLKLIALRMPTEIDRHRVLGNRVFASANRRRSRWNEEFGQALAEFQEAVAEWQAAGDRGREALTYSYIATLYRSLGDLPRSTDYFEKALAMARAEGSQLLEVEVMASLGYNYLKQGQVLKGVLSAREALNLSRARGDQSGQCRSLVMLGAITNTAGNLRVSQDYNRQALSFCRAAPIPIGERVALTQLADSFVSLGEPQQAMDYFNQALQVVTPAFDAMAQGHIRLNLARLKLQTGELQEALAQAQSALENFRQFGIRDLQGHTRLALGMIYRALGDDEQSFASFTQALEMSEGTGDQYLKALSYRNLAETAIRLGRRTAAERYLERAADTFREKGVPSSEVEAFKQRGRLELLRGHPVVAVDEFNQGLALSRKLELAAHETEILWLLGTAYAALNDREQAAESFRQALSQARERRLPDYEIQALGGLARLAQTRGDYPEAQTMLETALSLIETSRARIASPEFRVTFFSNSQSFYETYIEVLMSRHRQERASGDSRFAASALQAVERARARSLLELLTEAHADLRQGIDPALLDRERELQQRLSAKAERLWQLGQSGTHRERAAAIKAEMETITLEQRDLEAQIRVRSPRYAALQQPRPLTLPEIQRQVLDPDTLLLEYSLGERRSFLFAVTPTEIQSFVLPGRNEIERQTKRMLALLEASGRPQAFKSMAARRRWERTIQLLAEPGRSRSFRSTAAKQRWEERVQDDYQRSAALLSRSLLAPVGELLNHKRLLIVGDGVLHYLPFAALPEPAADASSLTARRKGRTAGLPPLVVNHEIAMIPSASTLAVLRQELNGRPVASKMVAVLADPVFDRDDERLTALPKEKIPEAAEFQWSVSDRSSAPGGISGALFRQSETGPAPGLMIPRLPGSRREAEAIMSLVPETQKMAAFDFDANLATARSAELGAYRYLHFATHGLINSERPELSGLVLSLVDREGNRQPGILRTLDIYNLKLPVELVVLSACRTALGKESGGEGVMGLTRGFFYAGARRVIASLWMVNDTATAELMRRFYHELLSERRLSPAAALRAAQVSMWRERKWEAPYYWAAFTLQGEW